MNDPKHLTDDGSEATDLERELLLAAQEVRLPAGEKQAIWAGVALQCLPAVAPTAGAGAGLGAGSKLGAGLPALLKGLIVVTSVGGVSAGAFWLTRPHQTAPAAAHVEPAPTRALVSAAPAAPTPSTGGAEPPPSPADSATVEAAPTVSHAAVVPESPSGLRDESTAVLEIRRTLRAGDASAALRLLEQARLRFPHGALSQEREALGIEALAKSGSAAAASRKAEAFLRAHPKSPYAADVESFIVR